MSKRENIINLIYEGQISLWDTQIIKSKEYIKKTDESIEYCDKVLDLLDDNGKKIFNEFLDTNSAVSCYYEEERFKDGFILGARLIIDVLEDERYNNK